MLIYVDKLFSSKEVFACDEFKEYIGGPYWFPESERNEDMKRYAESWDEIFHLILDPGHVRIDRRSTDRLAIDYIVLKHKECFICQRKTIETYSNVVLEIVNLYTFRNDLFSYFSKRLVNVKMFDNLV